MSEWENKIDAFFYGYNLDFLQRKNWEQVQFPKRQRWVASESYASSFPFEILADKGIIYVSPGRRKFQEQKIIEHLVSNRSHLLRHYLFGIILRYKNETSLEETLRVPKLLLLYFITLRISCFLFFFDHSLVFYSFVQMDGIWSNLQEYYRSSYN